MKNTDAPIVYSHIRFPERAALPHRPGIYFVCDGNAVQYVGKTIDLNRRLTKEHHKLAKFKELDNPHIAILELPQHLLAEVERHYISLLAPPMNGTTIKPKVESEPERPHYGLFVKKMVRDLARWEDIQGVCKRQNMGYPRYHDIINPNRGVLCPTGPIVSLTKETGNYSGLRQIAKDCGGVLVTPEDIEAISAMGADAAVKYIQEQILGMVKDR